MPGSSERWAIWTGRWLVAALGLSHSCLLQSLKPSVLHGPDRPCVTTGHHCDVHNPARTPLAETDVSETEVKAPEIVNVKGTEDPHDPGLPAGLVLQRTTWTRRVKKKSPSREIER